MNLMPPPVSPVELGTLDEWANVEREIGIALPNDYKIFIQTYGTGVIGRFLQIWNPLSKNKYMNLKHMARESLETLRIHKTQYEQEYPFALYPEKEGLLPFADTANGDLLLWKTNGLPDTWELLFLIDFGPQYEAYSFGFVEFLIKVLGEEIESLIFSNEAIFKREEGFMSLESNNT
jgi:hypothetical protein